MTTCSQTVKFEEPNYGELRSIALAWILSRAPVQRGADTHTEDDKTREKHGLLQILGWAYALAN